jgi:xylose isomerase
LLHAHIGGMDVSARGLLIAARMIEDGALARHLKERYAGWDGAEGKAILAGQRSLADLAASVEARNHEPQPRSGRQEYLENLLNSYV